MLYKNAITEKSEYKQERQAVSVGKKQQEKLDGLLFLFFIRFLQKFYLSMIPFPYF